MIFLYRHETAGLASGRMENWTQSRPHRGYMVYFLLAYLLDYAQSNDRYGWSLSVAELDGRPGAELVVGIPYETSGAAVHVLIGEPQSPPWRP